MSKLKPIAIVACAIIFSNNVFGQNGPGGIGSTDGSSTLELWLKSDTGVEEASSDDAETGDNVLYWLDQSGNGNDLANDYGSSPTYKTDGTNNYIDFSAGSKYLRGSAVISGTTARTMFVVTKPTSLNSSSSNCAFALAPNESTGKGYGLFIESPSGSSGMGLRVSGNKLMNYTTSTTTPTIISCQSGTSADVNTTIFCANGTELSDVATQTSSLLNTSSIGIMAGGFSSNADNIPETTFDYNGYLYEVIVFSEELINVKRNIIANYLSAKYGISLASNAYFSPADAAFINNLTGIGQESDGSVTSNSSSGWYYEFAADADNGDYLLMANDNATNNVTNLVSDANTTTCGATKRWNKLWYLEKTGNYDLTLTVDFSEAFDGGATPIGNSQNYVLLYRGTTSGDFTIIKSAYSKSGNQLVFNLEDADFSTGYFTIGTLDQTNSPVEGGTASTVSLLEGPAGIGNNKGTNGESQIVLWLDANDLSYSDGETVQNWTDKSENNNSVIQINPENAPVFKTNAINTNQSVIQFNPGSGITQRLIHNNFTEMPSDSITTFIIYKTSDYNDGIFSYAASANSNEYLLYNSSNITAHISGLQNTSSINMQGEWNILTSAWRISDGDLKIYKDNDNSVYSATSVRVNNDIASGGCLAIGGEQDAIDGGYESNQAFTGEIAEILVYNDFLSDAEIGVVSNYLNLKYGDTDLAISKDGFDNSTAGNYIEDFVGIGKEADGTMPERGRGGLYFLPDNLTSNGDYIFGANNGATNNASTIDRSTDVTNAGAAAAWNRMYYIEKLGTYDPVIAFDIPEAFENGKYIANTTNYELLYRSATTGNYSIVTTTKSTESSSKIVFTITNSDWNNGFYTLGTTNETTAPLCGMEGTTFYAYLDADWDNVNTWSTDENSHVVSGYTPSTSPTANIDHVVIRNGVNVTVTSNNLNNASLDVIGTISFGTTTGHSFDEIKGNGRIELKANNFPDGDATQFVGEGYDEGTVVFLGSDIGLNTDHEFFNVEVQLDNKTNIITLTNNLTINGYLRITKGILQINNNASTTNLNITVKGDLSVGSNGSILTGEGNARHQFNLYGNVTNNGTMKFTNRTSLDTQNEADDGIVDVNFLSEDTDQEVSLNGVSNFYRIEINKGNDQTYIVNINADETAHFNLFGWANENHTGDKPYRTANNNSLGLVAGTVKIGSNIVINMLSDNGNYDIPEKARLWINGGTIYNNGGNATVPYGTLQITSGLFESNVNSGITIRKNGAIKIEGGTVNTAVIRTSILGNTNVGSYVQSGGTVNLTTTNGTSDYYKFCMTYTENTFNMSGGTINIMETGNLGGIFINSDPGNYSVTGGTINCDISNSNDFIITSKAPFYNLNLTNSAGNTYNHILGDAINVSSTDENLEAQPLVVLNNLTIGDDCFLHHNGQDITIAGNLSISADAQIQTEGGNNNNYGLYYRANTDGKNTLTFNGDDDSEFYIGHNVDDEYELHVWNFTVDKPSDKSVIIKGDTNKEAANVSTPYYARLLKINNTLDIEGGTLDQGEHSIRLYGSVNISSQGKCGVYQAGVTHKDALIMFKDADVVINTEDGAEFGNVKLNPENPSSNPITLTSNIVIKRIAYYQGLLDLGTYNLKIDYLSQDGTLDIYSSVNNGYDATTEQMFYSAGNASDGGISYYIPAGTADGTTFLFPLGVSGKYTPVEVTVSGVVDGGYISINPVNEELPTLGAPTQDDALQYYWTVDYDDFTTIPNVQMDFYYVQADVDGNEGQYVPGRILNFSTREEDTGGSVDKTNNIISFSDGTLTKGDYTAAKSNKFDGTVRVLYARKNGEWHDYKTWSTTRDGSNPLNNSGQLPEAGDICVIGNSTTNYAVAVSKTHADYASIKIARLVILRYGSGESSLVTVGQNGADCDFGIVTNQDIDASDPTSTSDHASKIIVSGSDLPSGDFGDFMNAPNTLFTFSRAFPGTNASIDDDDGGNLSNTYYDSYTIGTSITEYPVLQLEYSGYNSGYIQLPATDITVHNDIRFFKGNAYLKLNGTATDGDVLVEGDCEFNEPTAPKIEFPGTGYARTLEVEGDINFNSINNSSYFVEDATSSLENELIVHGSIINPSASSSLVFYRANDKALVNLTFAGEKNSTFEEFTTIPELYKLTVDKGDDQTYSALVNSNLNINAPTDGSEKAISILNGTLTFDHTDLNVNLTTGGDDFEIPSTGALEIKNGAAYANGNSGIYLNGKLKIDGGELDMRGSGEDNYIEYSSTGDAEIEITSGTLYVGSQIRCNLLADEGILKYTQTGGTAYIGYNSAPESTRGVFEVYNLGSVFNFTGGDLEIVRSNNSSTRPALYLLPASYSIGSDMTIKLGSNATPASQDFGIRSSAPLPNLEIDNSSNHSPTATIWTEALEIENIVTIESGSTLDANGNDLYIGGNFINDGTYEANSNTTYLDGTLNQTLSGSGNFSFYNLDKSTNNDVFIEKGILVNNTLTIEDGSLSDNDFTINLLGDLDNEGTIIYGGSGQGLLMNATERQYISGAGIIGKLMIENANDVEVTSGSSPVINDNLTLNEGIFDLGENLLTLNLEAEVTTDNSFSADIMIQTTKSYVDAGIKKIFPSRTADSDSSLILIPIGSNGIYAPISFYLKENSNSAGNIVVKAAHATHPSIIDDEEDPDTEIVDEDYALHFYWVLRSTNMADFSGRINFQTYDSIAYIANTSVYTQADYITARLLRDGSYSWDKFPQTSYDEDNDILSFIFSGTDDDGISGEYTAGVEPQTSTKKGAIPDVVKLYTSTADGKWSDDIWTPTAPAGGPRGARVQIDHTVSMDKNFNSSYIINIGSAGQLNIGTTYGHNLGDITGTGILEVESGNLPTGLYTEFVKSTGGTIEFSGSNNYTVLSNLLTVNNVSFTGTGERYLPNNNVTFLGDVTIDGDNATLAVINKYNKTNYIQGDLTLNQGTFDAGFNTTAIIELNGTSTQTISGDFTSSNSSVFHNLIINNSNGINVDGDIEIEDDLTLSDGIVTPSATGSILLSSTSEDAISSYSSSSYINGSLDKKIADNGSFIFPVGNSSQYKSIAILNSNISSGNTIWTAEYIGEHTNNSIKSSDELIIVSKIDKWSLGCPTSATGQVRLYWNSNSKVTGYNLSSIRVAKINDDVWHSTGSTGYSGNATSGYVTSQDSIHFSYQEFTLGATTMAAFTTAILPIELLSFEGVAYDNSIELLWTTASEINNDYFEIQRSTDAENFETIGTISGAGTSSTEIDYSFDDNDPETGINYYRLKQVDYDGSITYHETISVLFSPLSAANTNNFEIYPNPYHDGDLTLGFTDIEPNSTVQLRITDIQGHAIYNVSLIVPESQKMNLIPMAVDHLSVGMYIISIQTKNKLTTKQLIIN